MVEIASPFSRAVKTVVLTFATHAGCEFCAFYRSALEHGIYPMLLGWESEGDVDVLQRKAMAVASEIEVYDDDAIVLFVDSFDLLFLDRLETIVARFKALAKPILFAAEKGCYPLEQMIDLYPPSPTPWRFLNSGAYIAYAGPLKWMLRDMLAHPRAADGAMDQELATLIFLDRTHDIGLDYQCDIFMCMHLSQWDVRCRHGRYRNWVTGRAPAILHFNGNAKPDQGRFNRQLRHAGQSLNTSGLPSFEAAVLAAHCKSVRDPARRRLDDWLWSARTGYIQLRHAARARLARG